MHAHLPILFHLVTIVFHLATIVFHLATIVFHLATIVFHLATIVFHFSLSFHAISLYPCDLNWTAIFPHTFLMGNLCAVLLVWRASEASGTLSEVTQWKSGIFVCFYIGLDIRMSFCTLTLTFSCLLYRRSVLSHTPVNRIFLVYFYPCHPKKLNCLPPWILLQVQLKLIDLLEFSFYSN